MQERIGTRPNDPSSGLLHLVFLHAPFPTAANGAPYATSALGVMKCVRVAILLRTWHEYLVLRFGLSRPGAIRVPFNTQYRALHIVHVFKRAGIVGERGLRGKCSRRFSVLPRDCWS